MSTSGSVTITAKMTSEEAERRLQALSRAEREVGAEAARSNAVQAQSSREAADRYDQLAASQRKFQEQTRSSAGDVIKLSANLSVLGLAALEAKEHVSVVGTGLKVMAVMSGPVGLIASLGALALAAKTAADGIEYLAETAVPAAGRAEASLASLRIVTERTGGNVEETTRHVEGLEDALTGLTAASDATRTFNTMGISLERQTQLIDAMRDGIVAMGGDVNAQLPLMALAIKRGESELLDNMGVVSTAEMMYKQYAATIGTTSDKLTQLQRDEALVQGVLQETAKYAGAAATAMQTYEGRIAALRTEKQKLAKEAGELVMPFANLGTEVERLGVAIERHIIQRLKEIGSPATGLAHDAQQALKSIFNQDYLIPGLSEQQQGEADMVGKTIKKFQAANAAERARQGQAASEGGYGPGNIVDLNKFYEEKAKREQAERDRVAREAKQDAERRKREAEQHAAQATRTNEQLRDRLAQLTLDRFDFERHQARRAFEDEVKLGADRELAARVLAEKLKAIAKDEAETRSRYFTEMWSNDSKRLIGQAQRIGASNVMGPFLPGQEQAVAAVGDETPAARQARRMEAEIADYVTDFNKAGDEAAKKQRDAFDDGAKAVATGITQSLEAGGALLAEAVRTGKAPAASGYVQAGASVLSSGLMAGAGAAAATGVGIPVAVGLGIAAAAVKIGGDLIGAHYDREDAKREAAFRTPGEEDLAITKMAQAAQEQLEAAQIQKEAAIRFAEERKDLRFGIEQGITRSERQLAVLDGKMSQSAAARLNAYDDADAGVRNAASKISNIYWGDDSTTDQYMRLIKEGGTDALKGYMKESDIEIIAAAIREAELRKAIADREADKDRVLPGATPQNPSYSVILNFKDFREAFPDSAYFRDRMSSGTTRGGGPGRGINTGRSI